MKTILLAGADGGIGSGIKTGLEVAGHKVIPLTRADADLTSYESIEAFEKKIATSTPSIDWIICAHGYIDTEMDFEKQSPEAMKTTLDVNSLSLLYLAKAFIKHVPVGGGVIVISSSAATGNNGRTLAYSTSKGAANTFAQSLARNKPDLNIFSICPGPTNTSMRERLAHDAATKQSPSIIADSIQKIIEGQSDYKSGDIITIIDGVEALHTSLK